MFARAGVVFGCNGLRGNEPESVLSGPHHCLSTARVIRKGIDGSNEVGVSHVEVRLWRGLCVRGESVVLPSLMRSITPTADRKMAVTYIQQDPFYLTQELHDRRATRSQE